MARRSSCGLTLRCRWNRRGALMCASEMIFIASGLIAVGSWRPPLLRVARNPDVVVGDLVVVTHFLEHLFEAVLELPHRGIGVVGGDVAAADQGLGVQLAGRALLVDQVVHQRLGEAGIVTLVVPAAAVADHVDHHVLVEFLAELEGQPGHPDHGLGIVPVHVEDRRADRLGHIGAVHRGAAELRRGGETDLVVDHHMDGATHAEAAQLGHLQRLVDHALTGEGRVAVHQDRQHGELVAPPVDDVLLGPGDALQDRIDRFQVGRIRRDRGLDGVARQRLELTLGARWYFTSPGALDRARVDVALELPEDLAVGLADDVGQHVQPAAVRHADDDLVHVVVGRHLAQLVQQHDRGLAALQGEPLLTDELGLQEGLEDLGLVQLVQDPQVFLARQPVGLALHRPLHPFALIAVGHVHVLDADGATVGVAQHVEDVAQAHERLRAAEGAGGEGGGPGPTGSTRGSARRDPRGCAARTPADRCRP